MDSSLKQRLVGAVVLVALAVIFLPMLVKGPAPDSGVSDVSLAIPAEPRDAAATRSVDLPLVVPDARGGSATGMPVPVQGAAAAPDAADATFPATAAGDYAVSFGSYASAADADRVIAALRSAELPAYREAATIGGRQAQRVRIGPFADRALAESARLRAAHVRDDVDARVITLDAGAASPATAPVSSTPKPAPDATATVARPVPLPPAPKPSTPSTPAAAPPATTAATPAPSPPAKAPAPADTSATGFAVQVGAFADVAAATALRDRLRGAGFNAFTDAVETESGRRTRVRAGPVMTRADADALKAQLKSKLGIDGIVRPHP